LNCFRCEALDHEWICRCMESMTLCTHVQVIVHTGATSAGSIESAMRELPSNPGMGALQKHAESGSYILKPGVADCGWGLRRFSLSATRNALKGMVQQMVEHMEEFAGEMRVWLPQPYFPTFAKAEYKVFVTPPPRHGAGFREGPQAMVVYTPMYETGTSPIYCVDDCVYSELFGPDGMAVAPQFQTCLDSGGGGSCHILSEPWHCPKLHQAIRSFALKCAGAITSDESLTGAGHVFVRVDVVCFFEEVSDEESKAYALRDPLVVLNELDVFGSASLHLDLVDPGRDGLRQMRPRGSWVPQERHRCQKY
jgi:hypothetical protein